MDSQACSYMYMESFDATENGRGAFLAVHKFYTGNGETSMFGRGHFATCFKKAILADVVFRTFEEIRYPRIIHYWHINLWRRHLSRHACFLKAKGLE